jgi:hypothetical protein
MWLDYAEQRKFGIVVQTWRFVLGLKFDPFCGRVQAILLFTAVATLAITVLRNFKSERIGAKMRDFTQKRHWRVGMTVF